MPPSRSRGCLPYSVRVRKARQERVSLYHVRLDEASIREP